MTSSEEPLGNPWEDLFDQLLMPFKVPERNMVEINPGSNENELCIKFVHNHFPREVTCKLDRLSDLVWSEAITWLHEQHECLVARVTSLANTEVEVARLQEENTRLRQQIFGTSSEKSAELEIATPATETLPQGKPPAKTPKPHARAGGRKPLPAHLPREDVPHELEAADHRIRYKTRQCDSVPILENIKSWLDDMKPKVTPGSGLGKAISYALGQWDFMLRYVDDGELSIDNNIAEREIKAVVIGRKNWLFADSPEGMRANAVMYSLVQTAKANGIDPFVYLRYVIDKMPMLKSSKEVECLLPWNMPPVDKAEHKLAA